MANREINMPFEARTEPSTVEERGDHGVRHGEQGHGGHQTETHPEIVSVENEQAVEHSING